MSDEKQFNVTIKGNVLANRDLKRAVEAVAIDHMRQWRKEHPILYRRRLWAWLKGFPR